MTRGQDTQLAMRCEELAATWLAGKYDRVREALAGGRCRARSVALAVGTMRHLSRHGGDDAAADFATSLTSPFGGHFSAERRSW